MYLFIPWLIFLSAVSYATITSSMHWLLKAILITCLVLSSVVSFSMIESYLGEPKETTVLSPELIIYGQLIYADKTNICILAADIETPEDALYLKLPYNQNLHKALSQGKKKGGGDPFMLKTSGDGDKEGEGDEKGGKGKGESGKNDGRKSGSSLSLESSTFEVFPLPPPNLPRKIE